MKKVNIQSDIESRTAIEHQRAFRTRETEVTEPKTEALKPETEIVEPKIETENGRSKEISGGTHNKNSVHPKKSQTSRGKTSGEL